MSYHNLADMFFSKRHTFADHVGYRYKKDDNWQPVTFQQACERTERISAGLANLGIGKGDKVAVICSNRLEWALSDYAVLSLGAVLVPIYPTLTANQIKYILNDSQASVLIVEDREQIDKINLIQQDMITVKYLFVIEMVGEEVADPWQSFESIEKQGRTYLQSDPEVISTSVQQVDKEDIATIIYTSGTTGEPKGVVLSHKNFLSNIESVSQLFECYPSDIVLSFLPLSHILERTAGHFFPCYHGACIAYAESIDTIATNMLEIRPTLMVSVPRLYEKIYNRILETVESGSSIKRSIFFWSVKVGQAYMSLLMKKQFPTLILKIKYLLAFLLVFKKLKARVGGRLRYFVSGGAPLSAEIGEFFNAAGLIILEGYGLTETSPGITFNRPDAYRFGTVGLPLPGVEVKFAADGEILTRGDHVMVGYFNKENITREVMDDQGWFYTGDIGFLDEDGFLVITDRKKNIIVTSGGKNIAPQPIENNLMTSQYIEQAVVIGDKRKFCSAVVVPQKDAIIRWANESNIITDNYQRLLEDPDILNMIRSEIDRLTEEFASFEKIQKFFLVEEAFTQQSGELTPTLKVKRDIVEQKYIDRINQLYI